jgi:hypothetical protein
LGDSWRRSFRYNWLDPRYGVRRIKLSLPLWVDRKIGFYVSMVRIDDLYYFTFIIKGW